MRNIKFSIIITNFILLMSFSVATAQWENISSGMGNLQVYSLFDNGNNIFAGTSTNGLYMSTNNGNSWTFAGLNSRIIFSLTMFNNYLYAGSDIGIWRTSNNGAYWIGPSINGNAIYSLGSNQTRVFAGLHNSGLFYSTGGSNWFISSLNATNVKAIAVNGDIIFAGCGNNSGVFKSTNNGNNWASTMLNNKSVYSLAVNGNDIFAGTGSGLFRSVDNGNSWIQTSLNNELIYSLAVNGNNIFAGTEFHGIYASSNNGNNWIQINEGLGNLTIYSLRVINSFIFAGASANGVYRRQLGEITSAKGSLSQLPNGFKLLQNYPNPFNPVTNIQFYIPVSTYAEIKVYNIEGKEVEVLLQKLVSQGKHEIQFDGSNLPSGAYFYTLRTGTSGSIYTNNIDTKKMMLIK